MSNGLAILDLTTYRRGGCRHCGGKIRTMAFRGTGYCCELCLQGSPLPHPSMVSQESDEARRRGR